MDATKVKRITVIQSKRSWSTFSPELMFINARNNFGAAIATMVPMTYIFKPEKSKSPIHWGQSSVLLGRMAETKFTYPTNNIINTRFMTNTSPQW